LQKLNIKQMEIINRPIYLNHIVSLLDRGTMIILIGQRRVGKSFMLKQVETWIKENISSANVLYISKELYAFKHISHADELYEYADAHLQAGRKNYLLIDEVQDIVDYENALRSLHAEDRCQIIATGSNAYVFSTELSTRLAGRYIEIPIHSLTYTEFLQFHRLSDSDKSLQAYLRVGGMPGLCHYDISEESQVRDYLQGVYNTVMLRDVVAREGIRNVPFIENLATFVADNIGKLISVRNIANTMKSQGAKTTDMIIAAYLKHLCNAYIISDVQRYDIHGKKLFEQNNKYYFSDHGLRNLLCGFNLRGSIEKIIENVVYHHLVAQGFKVTVGILRKAEIDFVAVRGDNKVYVQATYLLSSEETVSREFGNLLEIKDNYPKYVVSMDPVSGNLPEYPGVLHLNLREFLVTNL
jgi:predicted AAA+ superfamily ATPase